MSVPSPFDNPRLLVGRERELNVLRGHLRGAQKKGSFPCLDKGATTIPVVAGFLSCYLVWEAGWRACYHKKPK
jgi:hypothetical protein